MLSGCDTDIVWSYPSTIHQYRMHRMTTWNLLLCQCQGQELKATWTKCVGSKLLNVPFQRQISGDESVGLLLRYSQLNQYSFGFVFISFSTFLICTYLSSFDHHGSRQRLLSWPRPRGKQSWRVITFLIWTCAIKWQMPWADFIRYKVWSKRSLYKFSAVLPRL